MFFIGVGHTVSCPGSCPSSRGLYVLPSPSMYSVYDRRHPMRPVRRAGNVCTLLRPSRQALGRRRLQGQVGNLLDEAIDITCRRCRTLYNGLDKAQYKAVTRCNDYHPFLRLLFPILSSSSSSLPPSHLSFSPSFSLSVPPISLFLPLLNFVLCSNSDQLP